MVKEIRADSTLTTDIWAKKFESLERMEPAVYMTYTSQNFRLFLVSNLTVLNFRIFCSCMRLIWLKWQSPWLGSDLTHLLNAGANSTLGSDSPNLVRVESNLAHNSWVEHNPARYTTLIYDIRQQTYTTLIYQGEIPAPSALSWLRLQSGAS